MMARGTAYCTLTCHKKEISVIVFNIHPPPHDKMTKTKWANGAMDRITMPSALLSCLQLIPLRGQESCQKQVVIRHRGRSLKIYVSGDGPF